MLKAINNFWIRHNLLKYCFTFSHFVVEQSVLPGSKKMSLEVILATLRSWTDQTSKKFLGPVLKDLRTIGTLVCNKGYNIRKVFWNFVKSFQGIKVQILEISWRFRPHCVSGRLESSLFSFKYALPALTVGY